MKMMFCNLKMIESHRKQKRGLSRRRKRIRSRKKK